jgi:hypothetical protein
MMDAEKLWCEMKLHLDHDRLIEAMEASRRDRLWFYDHLDELRREYLGKWVAIKDTTVIDADRNHDRLFKRIMQRPGAGDIEILPVLPKGTIAVY